MGLTSFANSFADIGTKIWDKLPALLLTLIGGYLLIKLVRLIVHSAIRVSHANQAMKGILLSVIDIGLWMFLLAALFEQVGLSQIALALSGTTVIIGLAISTGSSVFIQDLISGLFLAQDRDFNTGDTIKSLNVEGVVERMDARKIRLRDKDGLTHVLPNSLVDKAEWIVIKRKDQEGK